MSGGDAPEQEVPFSSKQQAYDAAAKYEEWRDDGYQQLELDALKEANKDYSHYLQGRSSADVAQAAAGLPAATMQASGGQSLAMDAQGHGIAEAFASAQQDAREGAMNLQTQQRLSAAGVGNNVAMQSAGALDAMAKTSTNNAIQQLQRDAMLQNSENAMKAQIVGGAMSGGMMRAGSAVGSDGSFDKQKFKDGMSMNQMLGTFTG